MESGKSMPRVDAYDKVSGRAKYTDDLCPSDAYVVRLVHSTIAHGRILSVDTAEAAKVPGVVKIVTCFEAMRETKPFPTAGHPWSTDVSHQDIIDRWVLTDQVKYYGDDVAAVIAENEVAASQAVHLVKLQYEEYPFVLDSQEAIKEGAPLLHENYPNNILKHTQIRKGNFAEAIQEEGLIKVEGWYETPGVQHSHIENGIVFAYESENKMNVVASTQIPHIVRRVVGQALGVNWGSVRIIKPYIGGGFGNKQDALYEPLVAYLCKKVNGHAVKLDTSREETFVNTRNRHPFKMHLTTYVRKDGSFVARKLVQYANNGAYASHGHSICAKAMGAFAQIYPCAHVEADGYTVFTNRPVCGAMRGYGMPQITFAMESHIDDIAGVLGMEPLALRLKTLMPVGYTDAFSGNVNYYDSFGQCIEKGKAYMDYDNRLKELANQSGPIRRGIGMACCWYNTAVWPIALESSACRMVLNQDGSVQVQLGETEIGQGADTAFTQMAADALGVTADMVHVISTQDTDVTPFGTAAYASRQTYVAGFAITKTAEAFKKKVLDYAYELTNMPPSITDIRDNKIVRVTDGKELMGLGELAVTALYSLSHSVHIASEETAQIKSNAYSFSVGFVEVEVDIPMCTVKLKKIINVHDCGRLINPALAAAQVHGGQSMGIGFALSEIALLDEKTGRVLNNNFLDYKLSTAMDHPHLEAQFVENFEPTSPFGTKALGEPPVLAAAPAIRNAVLQCTGVAINELPLRPQKVFEYFQKEGLLK